jgi:hypothetical protein
MKKWRNYRDRRFLSRGGEEKRGRGFFLFTLPLSPS